jgi:putative component of membrane protein insertase Oxa1/YidC/SpoIIIJ protein YidD
LKKVASFVYVVLRQLLVFFGLGGGNCMYYPTCSEVIKDSLKEEGPLRTLAVVGRRIFICNALYKYFQNKKLVKNGNN